jgi:hypothetical protein
MQIELESSFDLRTAEFYDRLKHVLAAGATYLIFRWRLARVPSEPAFALS